MQRAAERALGAMRVGRRLGGKQGQARERDELRSELPMGALPRISGPGRDGGDGALPRAGRTLDLHIDCEEARRIMSPGLRRGPVLACTGGDEGGTRARSARLEGVSSRVQGTQAAKRVSVRRGGAEARAAPGAGRWELDARPGQQLRKLASSTFGCHDTANAVSGGGARAQREGVGLRARSCAAPWRWGSAMRHHVGRARHSALVTSAAIRRGRARIHAADASDVGC